VVTTNLPFADWVTVFAGDEKLTTALLDRLAHHAVVITTKGKSYRMRKRRAGVPRRDGDLWTVPAPWTGRTPAHRALDGHRPAVHNRPQALLPVSRKENTSTKTSCRGVRQRRIDVLRVVYFPSDQLVYFPSGTSNSSVFLDVFLD